jgi:ribose transport system substrate-binding protein
MKPNMKKILNLLIIGALVCNLTSCGSGSSTGEESGKLQIAVIPKGTTHFFWKSIHAGAEKAAQELGVEVVWQGPQKEDDRQMQIQVVQNFISRGIAAIVLAPLDDRSLVPPVQAAVKRDIPVVIIDSDLNADVYASFISTDNRKGGQMCADRLAEVLGGKGKVIMLRYSEGSASTTNREAGFMEKIKEYPDIEVVSDNQYAGATIEKGFQASQNLLNRFPEVDGIFCPNESATTGMLRALQTAGRTGKVKLVGFDSSETLIKAVQNGELAGFAQQDPFQMGYLGVKTAVAVIEGKTVEKRVDTGVTMVTPDNLEEPEVQELIYPELDKWLDE